ncbi:hypothetical protein C2W62_32505 [Candidatus Entotheonella serta]|nr:hypothetical protein C2W62_32505 [Candidatus Entotheonella serta]
MPYVPYAWQQSGRTISLESTQSKRLNVLGFMNKRNELEAYTFAGTVDGAVVIRCIDELWAYTSWSHLVRYIDEGIQTVGDKYKIHFG